MRFIAITAALALAAAATAAAAAPATVHVSIGPKLQKKAEKTYGVREVDQLAAGLQRDVERQLERTGALQNAQVELVLVDAKPNRPTLKEMGDRPGLSFSSFSVGGARIEGRATSIDGSVQPLTYSWYETDIRQSRMRSTWSDAELTFDRFARRLSRGQELASR